MMIEDRGNLGYDALYKATQELVNKARSTPELAGVFSGYAAGIGILAAQAVLVRALETVPEVRKQIVESA